VRYDIYIYIYVIRQLKVNISVTVILNYIIAIIHGGKLKQLTFQFNSHRLPNTIVLFTTLEWLKTAALGEPVVP
jgi:hypothetical protein